MSNPFINELFDFFLHRYIKWVCLFQRVWHPLHQLILMIVPYLLPSRRKLLPLSIHQNQLPRLSITRFIQMQLQPQWCYSSILKTAPFNLYSYCYNTNVTYLITSCVERISSFVVGGSMVHYHLIPLPSLHLIHLRIQWVYFYSWQKCVS